MSDEDTDKRGPHDEDRTPVRGDPPEHLPPREVKRIERMLGRKPNVTQEALAERYRAEGADPIGLIAQIAVDVHDMRKPIDLFERFSLWIGGGLLGGFVFIAILVSHRTETDTAVEYRLRAAEELRNELKELRDELKEALQRINRFRPDYPVATAPPASKGPPP